MSLTVRRRHHQAIEGLDNFIKLGVPENLNKRLDGKKRPSVLGSDAFKGWVEITSSSR